MKNLLSVFYEKNINQIPPIWLMRQAGRYLPEYRELRKKSGGFLKLCYNPDYATEITLQPIRRFNFDAAILFADILLLPNAMGQNLWFVEGEGPRLNIIKNIDELEKKNIHEILDPVYKTIEKLKISLPKETSLIGFAGAPWTVASYMIAGRSTAGQEPALELMKNDRKAFKKIIDILIENTVSYLEKQVEAGAEVLQLFDSWAGSLSYKNYEDFCLEPIKIIVKKLREKNVTVPIIGFPRGIGNLYKDFSTITEVNGISVDESVSLEWLVNQIDENIVLQGNLSNKILLEEEHNLEKEVHSILKIMEGRRHIFNLGHGILPKTPIKNVEYLLNIIRNYGT